MKDERDREARELEELDVSAQERAEAEAWRRVLEGEETSDTAPPELAATASLVRAGGALADRQSHEARLVQIRDELLRAPEWSGRERRAAGLRGWRRLWSRYGWLVLIPAGAMAAAGLGMAVWSTSPVPLAAPEARVALEQNPNEPRQQPGGPPPIWQGLPRPTRSLLLAQARVATVPQERLETLRQPMAAFRRELYARLAARYRRHADQVGLSGERLATR